MIQKLTTLLFILCLTLSVQAQKKPGFSKEEFRAKQEAYLTQKAELTAEEATKILSEICCENELCGGCPISEAKGKMTCQSFRRDKTEEVLEILKRWKKDHEKKEVEVESKLYCRIIDGGDGLTVRSEALQDGINLNDEIKEILAKYCSEHVGDYFALCEKRWMVKQ